MVEALKANVALEKTRILAFIGKSGPIVSNTIAKSLNLNSFLTAALLSELVKAGDAQASSIRVGGSPLYYLKGQEEQLERFTGFLRHKEKEAYDLLKKEGVLQDSRLEPAIRVAIKDVKDFAIPLSVNKGNENILFWKFRFFAEADGKIKDMLKAQDKTVQVQSIKQVQKETKEVCEKPKKERKKAINLGIEKVLEKWASENKIIVTELLNAKGKDAKAKIKVKTEIGEIDFLLVLKNKKSISEPDLAWAYQEGLNVKMPVIFLSPGKASKQVLAYLEGLGKGIVLRKL
jgi:uncharacterized membrane protein